MKKLGITLSMVLLTVNFLWAATVSLKGTVKNNAGAAITGARVALAKLPTYHMTTDAQGAFNLNAPSQVLPQSQQIAQFQFALAGKALVISPIFEKARGCVEVFFTNGRKNISLPFSGNRTGKQIVNLPEFVSGLNIIRVTIGNETITRTLVCLGNSTMYLKSDIANTTTGGNFVLAKSAATTVVDTLIVTKANYMDKKMTITSYNKDSIAVTLDTAGTIPPPGPCTLPTLPEPSGLTKVNEKLPDPFTFYDGTKLTKKSQWECRRKEILAMAEKYVYGPCPPKPDSVWGTVSGGTVSINCKQGSKTASFSGKISGSGDPICVKLSGGFYPSPAKTLDVGSGNASKIQTLFGVSNMVENVATGWVVDRVMDVLEANPTSGLDPKKIMVSGCSGCGKGAFEVGVFSRIPLTVIVESGGGGVANYRMCEWFRHGAGKSKWKCADDVPQSIDNLESNGICGPWVSSVSSWLSSSPAKVKNLPYDQNDLLATIAPRACCHFTNHNGPEEWCHLGGTCEALSSWAAEPVWNALGVPNNFGFLMYTETGTASGQAPGHCSNPASASNLANEFFKRVFQGDTTAKTDVMTISDRDLQQPQAEWKAMWVDWDMDTKLAD